MAKDLKAMLDKTSNKTVNNKENKLAENLAQFDKADTIMSAVVENKPLKQKKEKSEYVTYSLPTSYIEKMDKIYKLCMRNEVEINKSEIIRIGINYVSNLSIDDLSLLLDDVKVGRGRPKE